MLLKEPDALKTNADAGSAPAVDKKAIRQQKAARRERLKPLRQRLRKVEAELDDVQQALGAVEERLGDTGLYESERKEELERELKDQARHRERLEALEQEWLELSEELEAADLPT